MKLCNWLREGMEFWEEWMVFGLRWWVYRWEEMVMGLDVEMDLRIINQNYPTKILSSLLIKLGSKWVRPVSWVHFPYFRLVTCLSPLFPPKAWRASTGLNNLSNYIITLNNILWVCLLSQAIKLFPHRKTRKFCNQNDREHHPTIPLNILPENRYDPSSILTPKKFPGPPPDPLASNPPLTNRLLPCSGGHLTYTFRQGNQNHYLSQQILHGRWCCNYRI